MHLSMKTAFLLTMATARRVSEIHVHAFLLTKNILGSAQSMLLSLLELK